VNAVILCLLQAYFRWPLGFLTCWVLRGFNKTTAYISCTRAVKMLSQEYINQCYSSSKSINTSKVAFLPQWGSYPSERQCTCTCNAPLTLTYMHYPDSDLPASLHFSFFSYFYVKRFSSSFSEIRMFSKFLLSISAYYICVELNWLQTQIHCCKSNQHHMDLCSWSSWMVEMLKWREMAVIFPCVFSYINNKLISDV